MVKNLINLKPHNKAMMINSGMFSSQNLNEMRKYCNAVRVADLIEDNGCTQMVPIERWNIDPEASFMTFTSNETANGIEFDLMTFPWEIIPDDIPICIDMSSNIGTCHIPWEKVGIVYFGVQKNLGTAGCTISIIREDLLGHK